MNWGQAWKGAKMVHVVRMLQLVQKKWELNKQADL